MSSKQTDRDAENPGGFAVGDYDAIAELIWEVGAVVAGAAHIEAGMKVLDVATGTGNVAVRAAQAGGEVVGLDIAPTQLDGARRRAEEAGVQVEWVQGDATALPFADESFDRVLTAFGTTFAADHDAAALELVRVCRDGGEIVMANWCPESFPARINALVRSYGEPLPEGAVAPWEWGTHGHVRRRLGGQLVLAIEPLNVDFVFASVDATMDFYEEKLGPLLAAKAALDEGRYDELRAELRAMIEELDTGDGETRVPGSYLLVVGHKPVPDLRPNTT